LEDYGRHAEALDQAKDTLAALSDGPVKWEHGRGRIAAAYDPTAVYPHVWSSAHEAAAGIARLALEMLVRPLEGITDPAEQRALARRLMAGRWKALVIPLEEVAALQERIRRERAKLLWQTPPSAMSCERPVEQAQEPLPPRLKVDLARKTVTLDGVPHEVSSDNSLRWVKVLSEHPSEWISAPELKDHDEELYGARPDRLKQFLPPEILSLIYSNRRKGSRLRLP
jgi:hypothetical protein